MYEFLHENSYSVPDIVNYNNFDEIPTRKIIKTNNINYKYVFAKLFGNLYKPTDDENINVELERNLKDIKNAYVQNIIPLNLSIIRAYCNGYYWLKHPIYNIEIKNLGYYSDYQNNFINIYRSLIVDWLHNVNNIDLLHNLPESEKLILNNDIIFNIDNNSINKYIISLMNMHIEENYGLFELFIMHKIHNIPIVIIINDFITYYINNSITKINHKKINPDNYLNSKNICISIALINEIQYPSHVDIIYYK